MFKPPPPPFPKYDFSLSRKQNAVLVLGRGNGCYGDIFEIKDLSSSNIST